jgi:hypothetical protein
MRFICPDTVYYAIGKDFMSCNFASVIIDKDKAGVVFDINLTANISAGNRVLTLVKAYMGVLAHLMSVRPFTHLVRD